MLHGNSLAKCIFVLDLLVFLRHILLSLFIYLWNVILILDKMLLHVLLYLFFNLLLMLFDHSMVLINCVLALLDGGGDQSFGLLDASFGTYKEQLGLLVIREYLPLLLRETGLFDQLFLLNLVLFRRWSTRDRPLFGGTL